MLIIYRNVSIYVELETNLCYYYSEKQLNKLRPAGSICRIRAQYKAFD